MKATTNARARSGTQRRSGRRVKLTRVVIAGKTMVLRPHALRLWRLTQRLKATA